MKTKPSPLFYTSILGALSAIPPLSIDMGLPALPLIESTFPEAVQRGPLTLSLFLVGFALSPLPAGALADRYGRRPVLLTGLALMTLAAIACAFAPTFTLLLAFRLAQGVGAGMCVVMPIVIVRDLFEGAEARVKLSQITAVLGIAPMLAPIVGAWVLKVADWRSILGLQATAGLLLFSAVALRLPESMKPEQRQSLGPRALLGIYRTLLSTTQYRNFTLLFAFGFACIFTYISSSSTILMDTLGLSAQAFSVVFAMISLGMIAGSVAGGILSKRGTSAIKLVRTGVVGMVLFSLLMLALVLAGQNQVWVLSPLVALLLGAFGLAAPSATHEAMALIPQYAGAGSGVSRCLQMGMAALASVLVVAITSWAGPAVTMAVLMLAFSTLAGVLLILQLRFLTTANER